MCIYNICKIYCCLVYPDVSEFFISLEDVSDQAKSNKIRMRILRLLEEESNNRFNELKSQDGRTNWNHVKETGVHRQIEI